MVQDFVLKRQELPVHLCIIVVIQNVYINYVIEVQTLHNFGVEVQS